MTSLIAAGSTVLFSRSLRGPGRAAGGGEQFKVHALFRRTVAVQGVTDVFRHLLGATDEGCGQAVHIHPAIEQGVALGMVDPPVVQVDVLLLPAEDVHQVEAFHVAVLQVLQLIPEQSAGGGAVAVEQGEPAFGLGFQGGLEDRQNRRDAAAGGDRQVVALALGIQFDREVPLWRHHFQGVARFQRVIGEGGEAAAGNLLDRDAQLIVPDTGADRIGAAHFLAVQPGTHHQVLALCVAERVCKVLRQIEAQGYGVSCFRPDLFEGQWMEFCHGRIGSRCI